MISEVFYQNANNNYQSVVNDYSVVRNHVCKNPQDNSDNTVFCALKTIAPVRRVISAEEEAKQGNILPALGCASLMLINAREDLRDLRQAWEQSKAFVKGEKYLNKYGVENYKDYQHTFSSIRGMEFLENWVKAGLAKGSKWAEMLFNLDTTLLGTETGKNTLKKIGVMPATLPIETKIKELSPAGEEVLARAFSFKGSGKLPIFGELTGRAMARTTKLGILILAALEAPKIIKAMTQGETIGEQAKSTIKQTANSAIKVTSVTAGMAYGGALGHKLAGPTGSLIGMGCGAILGSTAVNKLRGIIS